ncbi:phage baseplate assembly protein V [Tissierella praeacuta]|uniref:phage baseplate assembly protein V n=1 Tax=Tissierella praeacuta TaxID=43131 RepID=UPI003DA3F3C0
MDVYGLLNNLIRIGTISSINPNEAKARVMFEDRDNLVSKEFSLLFNRTIGIQDYVIPMVGEQVVCLLLPNGLEEGYILGSFYTKKNTPPANDENKRLIKFEDGTLIEYDKGQITINGAKDINIVSAKVVNISGSEGITINGDVKVNGNIRASGNIVGGN